MWLLAPIAGLFVLLFPKQTNAGLSSFGKTINHAAAQMFGPPVPADFRQKDIDTLARTIWGEARGEGEAGMQAVANVIVNRYRYALSRGGYWWGNTIEQICTKAYQFSVWLKSDPNYKKMISVTRSDPLFALAYDIAERAVRGTLPDITKGADHYHTKAIAPKWSINRNPVKIVGYHVFYRIDTALA